MSSLPTDRVSHTTLLCPGIRTYPRRTGAIKGSHANYSRQEPVSISTSNLHGVSRPRRYEPPSRWRIPTCVASRTGSKARRLEADEMSTAGDQIAPPYKPTNHQFSPEQFRDSGCGAVGRRVKTVPVYNTPISQLVRVPLFTSKPFYGNLSRSRVLVISPAREWPNGCGF